MAQDSRHCQCSSAGSRRRAVGAAGVGVAGRVWAVLGTNLQRWAGALLGHKVRFGRCCIVAERERQHLVGRGARGGRPSVSRCVPDTRDASAASAQPHMQRGHAREHVCIFCAENFCAAARAPRLSPDAAFRSPHRAPSLPAPPPGRCCSPFFQIAKILVTVRANMNRDQNLEIEVTVRLQGTQGRRGRGNTSAGSVPCGRGRGMASRRTLPSTLSRGWAGLVAARRPRMRC